MIDDYVLKNYIQDIKKYVDSVSGMKISMLITTMIFLVLYYQQVFLGYIYMGQGDPINSYVPHFLYFQDAIRNADFGLWSFSFGIGNSIFTNSAYYFDIFNALLLVMGEEGITLFLILTLYLKYLSVTFFMYKYLELIGIKHKYTKVFFTVAWTFNGFMLLWGEHYFFATAVVYFTMMVYGLELFLQTNKKVIFSLSVFLTAILSLYVLTPMSIFVVIYTISWSILNNESNYIKVILKNCVLVGILAIIAILCSAPIVLPQIALLMNSPRVGNGFNIHFTNMNLMTQTLGRMFSLNLNGNRANFMGHFNYWERPQLTSSIFVLVCFLSSFKDTENKKVLILKIMLLVGIILMITTNVVSGATTFYTKDENRMLYPMVFAMIIVAAKYFDSDKYEKNNFVFFIVYMCAALSMQPVFYYVVSLNTPIEASHFIFYSFFVVFLCIGLYSYNKNKKIVVLILMFEIVSNTILDTWFINRDNIYGGVLNDKMVTAKMLNEIESLDNSGFYRNIDVNEGTGNYLNLSVMPRYRGVNTYSSLVHPQYFAFATQLGIQPNPNNVRLNVADSEFTKNNLYNYLGVKYLMNSVANEYAVNDMAYGLGTLYTDIIKQSDISEDDTKMKSYALLNYAILPDDSLYLEDVNSKIDFNAGSILESSVDATNQISVVEGTDNSGINYVVNGEDPQIVYNVSQSNIIKLDINTTAQVEGVMEVFYGNEQNPFSEENKLMIPYGPGISELTENIYSNFEVDKVRIDFGVNGENVTLNTEFKSIDGMKSRKEMYSDKTFVNVTSFENTHILGDISTDEDGILVFTMPLDKGWSIFANGVELEKFQVDYGMTGVYLEKGTYNLELKYENMYFNIGCGIGLISISAIVIYLILVKKRNSNNKVM